MKNNRTVKGETAVNYILFLVASSIEYFGTFIFMFALFRFRLYPRMISNILLISFLMSQVSYFTRQNPEIGEMSTYIQFILFVFVLWIMFRVPIFHSVVMNFAGLAINMLTGGISILGVGWLFGIPTQEILQNIWIASSIQVLSAVMTITISRTVYVFNLGFDFVPTSSRGSVHMKGTNAVLLVIILSTVVLAALTALMFKSNFTFYLVCSFPVFLLTIPIFLYYAIRKDNEDAS